MSTYKWNSINTTLIILCDTYIIDVKISWKKMGSMMCTVQFYTPCEKLHLLQIVQIFNLLKE